MPEKTYHTYLDQLPHSDARVFRAAILNGVPAPAEVIARLEAVGINIGELEQRLRQNMGFRS